MKFAKCALLCALALLLFAVPYSAHADGWVAMPYAAVLGPHGGNYHTTDNSASAYNPAGNVTLYCSREFDWTGPGGPTTETVTADITVDPFANHGLGQSVSSLLNLQAISGGPGAVYLERSATFFTQPMQTILRISTTLFASAGTQPGGTAQADAMWTVG